MDYYTIRDALLNRIEDIRQLARHTTRGSRKRYLYNAELENLNHALRSLDAAQSCRERVRSLD